MARTQNCLALLLCFIQWLSFFALSASEAELPRQTGSVDGVIFSLSLNTGEIKSTEPIIVKLSIANDSAESIFIGSLFNGLDFSVIEENINFIEYHRTRNGVKVLIGPKRGDKILNPAPLTLYGEREKKLNADKGLSVEIKPKGKYLVEIPLSRVFDFSRTADYLISCEVKYRLGAAPEPYVYKTKDMRVKVF